MSKQMNIKAADSEQDLRRCLPVMVQLRQHLTEDEFLQSPLLFKPASRLYQVNGGG